MPGIEIFENKLLLFLGGLIIYIILLTISIVRVRKKYWDTAKLSKRQRQIRDAKRTDIVWMLVYTAAGAMTLLLALTVNLIVAVIFAVASAFMIVLVAAASGRSRGKESIGENPYFPD